MGRPCGRAARPPRYPEELLPASTPLTHPRTAARTPSVRLSDSSASVPPGPALRAVAAASGIAGAVRLEDADGVARSTRAGACTDRTDPPTASRGDAIGPRPPKPLEFQRRPLAMQPVLALSVALALLSRGRGPPARFTGAAARTARTGPVQRGDPSCRRICPRGIHPERFPSRAAPPRAGKA